MLLILFYYRDLVIHGSKFWMIMATLSKDAIYIEKQHLLLWKLMNGSYKTKQ